LKRRDVAPFRIQARTLDAPAHFAVSPRSIDEQAVSVAWVAQIVPCAPGTLRTVAHLAAIAEKFIRREICCSAPIGAAMLEIRRFIRQENETGDNRRDSARIPAEKNSEMGSISAE
jgi:hypothetical protein